VTKELLPTSGEVIGVLIDAFGGAGDLPSAVQYMLSDRTSRRYFDGKPARRWCCRLSALCLLLYKRDLVRLPPVTIESKELSKEAFNLCAARESIVWDHLLPEQSARATRPPAGRDPRGQELRASIAGDPARQQ
jgi:hypothetical protein